MVCAIEDAPDDDAVHDAISVIFSTGGGDGVDEVIVADRIFTSAVGEVGGVFAKSVISGTVCLNELAGASKTAF